MWNYLSSHPPPMRPLLFLFKASFLFPWYLFSHQTLTPNLLQSGLKCHHSSKTVSIGEQQWSILMSSMSSFHFSTTRLTVSHFLPQYTSSLTSPAQYTPCFLLSLRVLLFYIAFIYSFAHIMPLKIRAFPPGPLLSS